VIAVQGQLTIRSLASRLGLKTSGTPDDSDNSDNAVTKGTSRTQSRAGWSSRGRRSAAFTGLFARVARSCAAPGAVRRAVVDSTAVTRIIRFISEHLLPTVDYAPVSIHLPITTVAA
jgi:hypothetical protein